MPRKNGYCAYCGNYRTLTVDHVVAKSITCQVIGNRLLVCGWCNSNKTNLDLLNWINSFPFFAPQHIYAKRFLTYTLQQIEDYYLLQKN